MDNDANGLSKMTDIMNSASNHSTHENDILEMDESQSVTSKEEFTQFFVEENMYERAAKRGRGELEGEYSEGEWKVVQNKDKKMKEGQDKIEMYITCKEKMPKQFALARLFKEYGIKNIERVKYINPYRVRIDITDELNASKLESCRDLLDKGWRIQKAMEKSFSYGIIRDVDLEMSEEDILQSISCPSPAVLTSIMRLKRRSTEKEGWSACETVRLCFKGSFLPPHVYVDNLRIKVEPFIFLVSQCSRCWKFGHKIKTCPVTKIVCPKCGENHSNCETDEYKCVNCKGNHMALDRNCPVYAKEKRIRELMTEFNCTFRRALTIYVPPEPDFRLSSTPLATHSPATHAPVAHASATHVPASLIPTAQTFAMITAARTTRQKAQSSFNNSPKKVPQKKKKHTTTTPNLTKPVVKESWDNQEYLHDLNNESLAGGSEEQNIPEPEPTRKRDVNFDELYTRLKDIVFFKNYSLKEKILSVIKCCIEWLILVVVDNVTDSPMLKNIINCFNGWSQ